MINADIETTIRNAASSLVQSRTSDEGFVLTLPSVYPSGSPVQVSISFDGSTFFVNDMGNAFHEAELLGATTRLFNKQAREVAEQYGVLFDNHSFFAIHVGADQVAGALKIIGAASLKSVVSTEGKLIEQNDRSIRQDFVDNLIHAFGSQNVARDVVYRGSSSHEWRFAAQVQSQSGLILFDTSSEAPNSVYSAHAKFSDLRRLEVAPKGVVGIPSFEKMKIDYRNLLQQVANVVEISSDTRVLERLRAG